MLVAACQLNVSSRAVWQVCSVEGALVQGPEQINIGDPDVLSLPQRFVVRAVEGVLKVEVRYIKLILVPRGVFEGPPQ